MKRSTLRAGIALACALSLSACGGGDGDLYLGGTITGGVTADGLILQNNGGDDLAVAAGASTFQFSDRVSTDDSFNITVKQTPTNASQCHVVNGSARANYYTIEQIEVYCDIIKRNLTVTVNGLTGAGLQLVNGDDTENVPANNGNPVQVAMAQVYQDGPYAVKVLTQPAGQTCTVTGGDTSAGVGNGSGTVGAANISNVVVTCAASAATST